MLCFLKTTHIYSHCVKIPLTPSFNRVCFCFSIVCLKRAIVSLKSATACLKRGLVCLVRDKKLQFFIYSRCLGCFIPHIVNVVTSFFVNRAFVSHPFCYCTILFGSTDMPICTLKQSTQLLEPLLCQRVTGAVCQAQLGPKSGGVGRNDWCILLDIFSS